MCQLRKKIRRNPLYVRKIMVCNVTNFSYNRGPPGGGLCSGSIGSIKDRCVIGTCEKNNFFRFPLWTRVWHLKCLQDIQWECFMKTRGQNIQKRPITDRPKIFRRRRRRHRRRSGFRRKMSTATCIPRRSPIQVLTGLNLA